jgi:hypothetical protein
MIYSTTRAATNLKPSAHIQNSKKVHKMNNKPQNSSRETRGPIKHQRNNRLHCRQDRIYVFPEMKLTGLVPNFHTHVSVSNLHIPTSGPPILLQQKKADQSWEYTLIAHRYMNVGTGNEAAQFHLYQYLF